MKLGKSLWKKLALLTAGLIVVGLLSIWFVYASIKTGLPQMITVKDYQPFLVSHVYDRNSKKIGEFFRERRTLVPFDKMPKELVNAFLAAEDDQFYKHSGINYIAILRAALANIRAGQTVQGASTITQQLSKTLLLTPERTLLRKIREALLAQEMEANLSKDEILYLYLNQIYFGQGAYGVENAAQTYFRKPVQKLTLPEMAILAGLPKAPSAYSPVRNPQRAKERQVYVLNRMADVGMISREEAQKAAAEPVKVFVAENYEEYAPYFLETVRLLLVQQLGEQVVLDQGIRIWTSLDLEKQKAAQLSVMTGLKDLDKRQGFRGPLKHFDQPEDVEKFLTDKRKELIADSTPERTILPTGEFAEIMEMKAGPGDKNLPPYLKLQQSVEAVVDQVDDQNGFITVLLPEARGLIDFETMKWARKPDPEKKFDLDQIKKPSEALKPGDVVLVRVIGEKAALLRNPPPKKKGTPEPTPLPDFAKMAQVELDQEPVAEAALLSFDQHSEEVLAMVGGSRFIRGANEFNRALQASRQTGSSFKAIVYASALDKGYNPSTPVMDAPLVYEETKEDEEGQEDTKVWKPTNHGKTFGGEITFRTALVKSLNVPTVKIIEDVGVPWSADYARRFGVFSPLNMDFTLALGSSSLTLYEMTKLFSQFGRLGQKIRPLIIKKVEDRNGKVLLQNVSLDLRFQREMAPLEEEFENRRKTYLEAKAANPDAPPEDPKKQKPDENFFFNNPDQLIKPQTAYIMTSLLRGVVEDRYGTGARARVLGREVAGKTGTTNGYFDAWFIGYTAQMATGVWVGFDKEKSLGRGEVGGRSALPIWVDYMKAAHEGLPQMTLPVADGIVFANIDAETGQLASASTKHLLRQAFVEGTEPTGSSHEEEETSNFYKQDLSE